MTLENELPVTVRVWLFNASSIGGLSFSYLPQTTVSELSPFTGPAYGGTRVFILGSYFASATESQFESGDARFCRFRTASSNNFTSYAIGTRHPSIGTIVAARWHSPTKIECITPPANVQTTQHVYVEVTSNGGSNFSSSHVAFTYFPPPTVQTALPKYHAAEGGSLLTVSGSGFLYRASLHSLLRCAFGYSSGRVVVPASYVSSSTVHCTTPAGLPSGQVQVEMSNNGREFTNDGTLITLVNTQMSLALPSSGPTYGGTLVRVMGTGLVPGATLVKCHFGEQATTIAAIESATSLSCRTPSAAIATSVTLKLSLDNVLHAQAWLRTPHLKVLSRSGRLPGRAEVVPC